MSYMSINQCLIISVRFYLVLSITCMVHYSLEAYKSIRAKYVLYKVVQFYHSCRFVDCRSFILPPPGILYSYSLFFSIQLIKKVLHSLLIKIKAHLPYSSKDKHFKRNTMVYQRDNLNSIINSIKTKISLHFC